MYVLYKLFLAAKIIKIIELRKFLLHFFDLNRHFVEKIPGSRRNLFGGWGKWA